VESLDGESSILVVDAAVEREQLELLEQWRAARDDDAVDRAVDAVRDVARGTDNLTPATIALARAGGTVGEWAGALREVFGEYRAPTGVGGVRVPSGEAMVRARERVQARAAQIGHPIRILVGKPGLDGHSNGAEQIAVAARDAGMEVVYQGIRLTPAQIAATARDEDVDVVGLSILSGAHNVLFPEILGLLKEKGGGDILVLAGGIIPDKDIAAMKALGIREIFLPGTPTQTLVDFIRKEAGERVRS
jgi:(2R)-ethylmalonyl-CoA mutase